MRYDSAEAREAIHPLYRNERRGFQNLFLPSVKLARKERVDSRLPRRYEAPQTPRQRLLASGAADPVKLGELQQRRDRLDPFQLSATIEGQLKKIFALSREAPSPSTTPASVERASVDTAAEAGPVAPAALPRPQPSGRSSPDSRKKQSRSAVEMTRRGKRGKLKKPKRVSHAFLRAWKSGQSQNAGFPHSHSAGGYG
jgi:hypothetical protein